MKAEYDRLKPEYALLDELLRAKKTAGLTQKEIAERMGTKPPAVSRLMNSLGKDKHSPSIAITQICQGLWHGTQDKTGGTKGVMPLIPNDFLSQERQPRGR